METPKPGTRCECRNCNDFGSDPFVRVHPRGRVTPWAARRTNDQCPMLAVRLVTFVSQFPDGTPFRSPKQVALCAACAEYQGAK